MRLNRSIVILGYSQAAMFLRDRAGEVDSILTIAGSREHRVEGTFARRLDLSFDDAEVPIEGDVLSLARAMSRKRFAEANGLIESPPTVDDARAIITFAGSIRDEKGTLLCHCSAGMSRAPAAALICLNVWRGEGFERECIDEVRSIRQGAVPHVGLIRYADQLLNREGKITQSLQMDRG